MERTEPQVFAQPSVVIDTLGCKLNIADSELLARDFLAAGFALAGRGSAADVYVLNRCTVTDEADAKARQQLRRARRRYPEALVVATGCYPARGATEVREQTEADLVLDNAGKPSLVRLVRERLDLLSPLSARPIEPPYRATFPFHRTRAFVKVQEGCNDHCSYCIIPQTRGISRFFPVADILAAVRDREAAGHAEVVLTGTQIGDYGIALQGSGRRGPDSRDQASEGDPLAALLKHILQGSTVPRVRLSSLQPQDVTPHLLALWKDPRLCPHFHLPLQSGSDPVLHSMRRRYTAEEYLATVARIRSELPHCGITTDLIVGFPGETDADFEASLEVCRAAAFSNVHVFPFSPRPRTLAARFSAAPAQTVGDSVKRERLTAALALADSLRAAALASAVGQVRSVLWEEYADHGGVVGWSGLTDTYQRVKASGLGPERGTISRVAIEHATLGHLVGRVVA